MSSRTLYDWSFCVVPRCKRRSRKFPSHWWWICGGCYRKGPKHLRDRRAKINRRLSRTRNPARRNRLGAIADRLLERIVETLSEPQPDTGMSPAMREQLRKDGLL